MKPKKLGGEVKVRYCEKCRLGYVICPICAETSLEACRRCSYCRSVNYRGELRPFTIWCAVAPREKS